MGLLSGELCPSNSHFILMLYLPAENCSVAIQFVHISVLPCSASQCADVQPSQTILGIQAWQQKWHNFWGIVLPLALGYVFISHTPVDHAPTQLNIGSRISISKSWEIPGVPLQSLISFRWEIAGDLWCPSNSICSINKYACKAEWKQAGTPTADSRIPRIYFVSLSIWIIICHSCFCHPPWYKLRHTQTHTTEQGKTDLLPLYITF